MRLLPGGAGSDPSPHRPRLAGPAALVPLLLVLGGAATAGAPPLPDGFGAIRFGMSVEEVRKLRPGLAVHAPGAAAPAPTSGIGAPLVLERFDLEGEEVLGLQPCRVGLHFANDRLYQLDFRCERPGEEIQRALLAAFGPARSEAGGYVFWLTRTRAVTVDPRTHRFSFTDRTTDELVQRFVLARALEAGLRPAGSGAEAPAGSEPPAPGAPARESGPAPGPAAAANAGAAAPSLARDGTSPLPDRSWFVDPARTRELAARLRSEAPTEEKLAVLAELSLVGDEGAADAVAPLLSIRDDLLFEGAVQALEDLAAPRAVAVLGEALAGGGLAPPRRLRVVEALGWLGRRLDVGDALASGLADPDPEVRREVAMTLGVLRKAGALPRLREALAREQDPETRRILARAVEVIGAGGSPEAGAAAGAESRAAREGG